MENVTSPRDRARGQLRECEALVRRLFETVDTMLAGRTMPESTLSPQQITTKLVDTQKALRSTVEELVVHQRTHRRIEALRRAIGVESAKISRLSATMRHAEALLQEVLDEAAPRLEAMDRANKRPLDVEEIVSYGEKISACIAAPPNWDSSQPLGKYLPPAPGEDMMRAGRLAQLAVEGETQAQGQ